MIEFEVLAIKAETNNMHIIFLLKKNVRNDIIKTILGYPLIAIPESLKEWKVAIILVRQRYKSIEGRQNYRTGLGIIYGRRGAPMDTEKFKDKYDKNKKPRYFNYNIYKHMAKDCQKPKKEKKTRKCYKYNKVENLAKNCRSRQKIKNRSIQEESDKEDSNKEESFIKGLE